MKRELPTGVVIGIIAVVVLVALGIGLWQTGTLGGRRVPETEATKPDEARQYYDQYTQGGQGGSPEQEARQQQGTAEGE